MDILDWLSGADSRPDTQQASSIGEAVERIVGLHPRLRLARHYQERLEPAAAVSLRYLREMVSSLPPPREASAAAWAVDPWIHAFFASADEVMRIFDRSAALRTFFDRNADLHEAHALLTMAMHERHVLGVAQHGDGVRCDVAQTVVNFSDHRVSVCGRNEHDLGIGIVRRGLDQLALGGLARAASDNARRERLQRERALLDTRWQMLERQRTGSCAMFGSGAAELARLQAQIDDNRRNLENLGSLADAIDHELECVREVLADPAAHLADMSKRVRLNRMNVVLEAGDDGDTCEIKLPLARIPGDPPQMRVFAMVRFARADMLDADSLLEEGMRLLF